MGNANAFTMNCQDDSGR